jgi:hypothetical protein
MGKQPRAITTEHLLGLIQQIHQKQSELIKLVKDLSKEVGKLNQRLEAQTPGGKGSPNTRKGKQERSNQERTRSDQERTQLEEALARRLSEGASPGSGRK